MVDATESSLRVIIVIPYNAKLYLQLYKICKSIKTMSMVIADSNLNDHQNITCVVTVNELNNKLFT